MKSLQTTKRRFLSGVVLAVCLAGVSQSAASASPKLNLTKSISNTILPRANAEWPTPRDANMVFYIQRSMNPNTVIYAARFGVDGALKDDPIRAYWRRYAEEGQPQALGFFERSFAYGVKSWRKTDNDPWAVTFAALSDLPLELRQSGPNAAALWASINNRDYKLIYGYLDLDESGLFARVVQLRLFTFDPDSKEYVTHLISVSGGDIRE